MSVKWHHHCQHERVLTSARTYYKLRYPFKFQVFVKTVLLKQKGERKFIYYKTVQHENSKR
jgi:hypothetical protein